MKTFKQLYQEINYTTEVVAAILPVAGRILGAAARNPHVQAAAIDVAGKVAGKLLNKKKLPPILEAESSLSLMRGAGGADYGSNQVTSGDSHHYAGLNVSDIAPRMGHAPRMGQAGPLGQDSSTWMSRNTAAATNVHQAYSNLLTKTFGASYDDSWRTTMRSTSGDRGGPLETIPPVGSPGVTKHNGVIRWARGGDARALRYNPNWRPPLADPGDDYYENFPADGKPSYRTPVYLTPQYDDGPSRTREPQIPWRQGDGVSR